MNLTEIQQKLKAPKNQRNTFGNYNYRSCEDILEAVKPLLSDNNILTIKDEIVQIGERYYIKATVTLDNHSVTAYAREEETKKGMDASQITGSASSYARKYALNGLFLIDDTKDADTMDNTKKTPESKPSEPNPAPASTAETMQGDIARMLLEMCVNEDSAENELERLTKWTSKEGKNFPGKRNPYDLGIKENAKGQSQTSVVHHQVKDLYEKWVKGNGVADADSK